MMLVGLALPWTHTRIPPILMIGNVDGIVDADEHALRLDTDCVVVSERGSIWIPRRRWAQFGLIERYTYNGRSVLWKKITRETSRDV